MGEKNTSSFCSQLRAVLVRNLLLKKRNTRNTIAEVFLPLYSLGSLILLKILIPNPNFPVMAEPRGEAKIFEHFQQFKNHTVAVAPNNTNTLHFLDSVNELWLNMRLDPGLHPINWVVFESRQELQKEYWREPLSMPLALIFNGEDPLNGPLQYEIRTNPNFVSTPSTLELYTSPAVCRQSGSHWSGVFPIEAGDSCPVNQYYYSGFIALQALLDYTKIRLASGSMDIQVPHILLEMFPKDAYTGNWMVAFRVVIPLYMVIALSQFITYLLILIVGEKENKIKEGMKIMGLRDSVFWLSWFIIYAVFVTVLTAITTVLLFSLGVFQNTSPLPVFLIILLYSYSVIMFGFMITPFFDNSRTAGILGNFAVNIMSLLYFIQVFVDNSSSVALWVVSLISPTGFALAMDKILVLDIQGSGVTLDNLWAGPGIPIGGSLIMMSLDIVLYGFLAYYLDCVIPSEHGTKRSPWFCFTPRFWCGKKSSAKIPLTNGESTSFNNAEEQIRDVEQVPREMKGREAIRIVDLYKTFHKCRKPEVRAVNGINLTIYEGQITAILGHNGAGKSTLFNILTGLTAPSSGTAYVFGYDIRDQNDMQQIRRMTGVCPQHDILFDLLTPREHLKFFAAVRGIPADSIEHEVNKTLRDIDMSDNADQYAKYLSGGQKRKLSVGIAIIGDPRIIILDEPTAGVDPYSRRHMWRLLQERKHGKVILLTTHFMDEADILAERKAVVSRGKLRCCGSSLFLKNKFGIGYHLTLVLDGVCREVAITRLVCQHVTKAERGRRHGRELSFILPHDAVDHFAPLFTSIEAEINTKANRLGICSYGVSMTTLEEVFLHLERDENETEVTMDNLSKKIVRNRALSRSLSLQSKSTSYQSLQNDAIASELDPSNKAQGDSRPTRGTAEEVTLPHGVVGLGLDDVKMEPSVARTLVALLRLRVLRLFRDLQKLYLMIAMPLVFAPIGLYLNSIQVVSPKMNSLMLNGATYGSDTLFLLHNATWGDNLDPLHDSLEETGATVEPYDGNFSLLLDIAPHMAALNVNVFSLPNLSFTLIYNDTTQHGLPVAMNLLSNAMYGLLSGEMSFDSIQTFAHPLQQTSQPQGFNFGTFAASFCIGTIFVLMPISLAVEMVYDREIKAKNQLRVNGLSSNLYFFTYFLVLATLMVLICFVLLLLILLFDLPALEEPPAMITLGSLLILYCPASILFTTCVSYIFDKADSAQSILPNITTFVGLLPAALVMMLDMFQVGGRAAYALHVVFSLINPMYLPFAVLYYVDRVHVTCLMNGVCGVNGTLTLADYCTNEIVVMLVGVLLHIPIWFVVLQVLDIYKSGGRVADVFKCFLPKRPDKLPEDPGAHCDGDGDNEDADVQLEREKVRNLQAQHHYGDDVPVVVVQNLRKEFPLHEQCRCSTCCSPAEPPTMRVAVRNLSLAVDAGEVLGLLGHNGAGKTTTMRIITAEMHPTRGRVQIGGHNITSSLNEAFRTLGYCPQHDALWKDITVREHLQVYAAIKGVPSRHIDGLVNLYLSGLQIDEHANKQAQHCSGGTRRKLSFAIAMVGSPRVVLLDEPSTGMDPRSKRFLWDTILASFQGSRGAILTTHSMEEADALCSRVGIMVKGELRCLGSTQHLKNLYGAGYTLEIKLKTGTDTPTGTVLPDTGDEGGAVLSLFTGGLFPDATLLESFADRLVYSVPQHAVTSLAQCFKELERAKDELHIEEYSFSQTTLEQVFLKFAQHDEEAVTQEAV